MLVMPACATLAEAGALCLNLADGLDCEDGAEQLGQYFWPSGKMASQLGVLCIFNFRSRVLPRVSSYLEISHR